MIRRLLAAATLACTLSTTAWAAPSDFGPSDGWAAERAKLETQRREPWIAGLLNALVPGTGAAYQGEYVKALAQAGGGLGVLVASQLISSGIFAVSNSKEAALFFSFVPYSAYVGYAAVDGYMSTVLTNERIDHRQEMLTPIGFRLQVARF